LVNRFTERYRTGGGGALEGEIEGGANVEGRELGVEEEDRM
jgi:hypothetical protein